MRSQRHMRQQILDTQGNLTLVPVSASAPCHLLALPDEIQDRVLAACLGAERLPDVRDGRFQLAHCRFHALPIVGILRACRPLCQRLGVPRRRVKVEDPRAAAWLSNPDPEDPHGFGRPRVAYW